MAAFDSDNSELLDVLPTGDNARHFLTSNYWTIGLQNRFILFLKKISIRYFVCDDSGSVRLLIEIMRIGYLGALPYQLCFQMLSADGNRTKIESNGEVTYALLYSLLLMIAH
jgi:hypothetical protein